MGELEKEFYSVAEAAELLHCGEKAVMRMMQRNEMPGQKHGKGWRFKREDLESFIERCERTGCWPDQRR